MKNHQLILTGAVLAGMLVAAAAASAQSEVEPRAVRTPLRSTEPAVPAALQEIYRRIDAYWEDQNAAAIARMAGGSRVYVVVQRLGVGERLAASQLHYVLQELFEGGEEVDVRFPVFTAYDPRTATGYAVGERVWADGHADDHVDRLFVSARNHGGHWLITEIRLTIE